MPEGQRQQCGSRRVIEICRVAGTSTAFALFKSGGLIRRGPKISMLKGVIEWDLSFKSGPYK